jgi:hypothetical protein
MKLRPIASNMTEVHTNKAIILFSYSTPVACCMNDGTGFYRTNHSFSVTTSKHINKWLDGANAQEREQSFFDSLV